MKKIAMVGCGYVADLYMPSLQLYPDIHVAMVHDRNQERLGQFCAHWSLDAVQSLDAILDDPSITLVLNLTNPGSHYAISKACLDAGKHVYSEKPLAMEMDEARELHRLAAEKQVMLASAPCSYLSMAARNLQYALGSGIPGKPYLVYAELDDDFIPQAPYRKWQSESGAPWPYRDEFEVGCTLEHAGYYLTWLMMLFGSVKKVVAASAELLREKLGGDPTAPDYATAMLFFESGVVARLTCSIVAPHDHQLRVFCENGVVSVDECWKNTAKVKFNRRFTVRRRLVNSPFSRTIADASIQHPTVGRRGAASMNFALGPAALLKMAEAGKASSEFADFALHLNEVTLAMQNAFDEAGAVTVESVMPSLDQLIGEIYA